MRKLLALLALLCLPQPVFAQGDMEASQVEEAAALVDKLQMDRQLDKLFTNLKGLFAENVVAGMTRNDVNGRMQKMLDTMPGGRDRFVSILGDEFVSAMRMRYPEFKAQAAQRYAELFSQQELHELNMFFSSGVGMKWLLNSSKLEEAMGEWGGKAGMKAGVEAMANTMQRIEAEQNDKEPSQ